MKYGPYRRAVQLGVFGLMFGIPLLNLYEIYALTGTFYSLNIGGLGVADPVVIFQSFFASGGISATLLVSATFAVFVALLFGRVWCGWMCPYHLLADASAWLRARFRGWMGGKQDPEPLPVVGSFTANTVRFGFLILGTVVAGAIGIPVLNYLSAPGILSTEAMILVKGRTVSLEMAFIVIILLMELIVWPRFWCRLFCPTGSFLSLFRTTFTVRVATGIRTPKSACCKGSYCSKACPMGLKAFKEGTNLLCTNCGQCIDACRAHDGVGKLQFKGFSQQAETS